MKNLRTLNLTDNRIERIENLNFPLLQYLYLDRNQIEEIANLGGVKKIEYLTLSGNKLKSPNIKGSEILVSLGTLDVSENSIAKLDVIYGYPKLVDNNLSYNPITKIEANTFRDC